jgi:hypothetical protein
MSEFKLTESHERWFRKRHQRLSSSRLRELLLRQAGLCALSGVELLFDVAERTPIKGGPGCHPLSPAVDHKDPGNLKGEFQIICYALNDLKGHMPTDCFEALTHTDPWKNLMIGWKLQAESNSGNRLAFSRLIRPNATLLNTTCQEPSPR